MRTTWKKAALGLATASTLISGALAAETKCFFESQSRGQFMLSEEGKTRAINPQPAKNDWTDIIWRGDDFYCPTGGSRRCQYNFGRTVETRYTWALGFTSDIGNVPILGSILGLANVSSEWTKSHSYSSTFNMTLIMDGGWWTRPVQGLKRRWTQGQYQGVWFRTASTGVGWYVGAWKQCQWYWWNDGANWGRWAANIEVPQTKFYTYDVKNTQAGLI